MTEMMADETLSHNRGKWSSKFLVSHRFDVSEFAELYDAFDKRQGGLMKVFVQTRHRSVPLQSRVFSDRSH